MKINLHEISIRDLTQNYQDNAVNGVTGFSNRLNIRPPYQREFVYNDKQRDAVIRSVFGGFPLNTMYWSVNDNGTPDDDSDDTYELIDGQQRTVSICQYVDNGFAIELYDGDSPKFFHNLTDDERTALLNYKLQVYFCEGTEAEKLDWFNVINTVGEKLTDQELRNAVYAGPFVTDAKAFFSKPNAAGVLVSKDYVKGNPIRQELLEKALDWMNGGDPAQYMAQHQHDDNANALKRYWNQVMHWIEDTFTVKRSKEMKQVPWGLLYDAHKNDVIDPDEIEARIKVLMIDDDVTKKAGIYDYVLTGNERKLSIRGFSTAQAREAYERQNGICPMCNKHFEFKEMQADHIVPWSKGGRTVAENCQMLCADDNRTKSGK